MTAHSPPLSAFSFHFSPPSPFSCPVLSVPSLIISIWMIAGTTATLRKLSWRPLLPTGSTHQRPARPGSYIGSCSRWRASCRKAAAGFGTTRLHCVEITPVFRIYFRSRGRIKCPTIICTQDLGRTCDHVRCYRAGEHLHIKRIVLSQLAIEHLHARIRCTIMNNLLHKAAVTQGMRRRTVQGPAVTLHRGSP